MIERRGNYGWPDAQGGEGAPEFKEPVVNYEDVIAPSGATFVRADGSAWTGSFVFAALVGEQLRRIELSGGRATVNEALFQGRLRALPHRHRGTGRRAVRAHQQPDGRGSPRDDDDRVLRIIPPRN